MATDDSPLGRWARQAENPAAPAGLRQTAQAAAGFTQGDPHYADSTLGRWAAAQGFRSQSRSWYTGANREGIENGWNTEFAQKFMDGQNKAGEAGTLGQYFESEDATGVVLWDHDSSDGEKRFRFGDIYEDGSYKGNVYEDFDEDTANMMMSVWTLSPQEHARAVAGGAEGLAETMKAKRGQLNRDIAMSTGAGFFAEDVKERAQWLRDGVGDELIVGGSTLGSAAVGAGFGSFLGPGGTALGAGIGGAVGFVGSMLNRDELTEFAARAWEITAARTAEDGLGVGIFEGVRQWSGFAQKITVSGLDNLTHGIYDAAVGTVGDGESEYYRRDAEGNPERPGWMTALSFGTQLADMAFSFASPWGSAMYMTSMRGSILGNVGGLTFSGGKTWDDRRGGFDNIFTNEDGSFDPISAGAGIANVGIEMVQLGMARGLINKADASRAAVGQAGFYSTSLPGKLGAPLSQKIQKWTQPKEVKAALAAGGRPVDLGGIRYILDANGKVLTTQRTIQLMAPSEQLTNMSARVLARREAARAGNTLSVDDVYRAANSLAMGEKKIRTALVTGFAEGYEEVAQSIFEPLSHNAKLDGGEIREAFFAGTASGIGMGLGTGYRTTSADTRQFNQAKVTMQSVMGRELTREEWNGLSEVEKRVLLTNTPIHNEMMKAAYDKIRNDQAMDVTGNVSALVKVQDAIQSVLAQRLAQATDRTDGSFVITQIEEATRLPSDAVGMSAEQLIQLLGQHLRGAEIQQKDLERKLVRDNQQLAALDAEADPELAGEIQQRIATAEATIEQIRLTVLWGGRLMEELAPLVEELYSASATAAQKQATTEQINQYLRELYHEQAALSSDEPITPEDRRAISKAVSFRFARDPHDQGGSYPILVPQISTQLTVQESNNVLEISHAVIPGLSADFDGDKIRLMAQLILDDKEFVDIRSGRHLLAAGLVEVDPETGETSIVQGSVNIPPMKYEKYIIKHLHKALNSDLIALQDVATNTLANIGTAIRNRYGNLIEASVLDQVLKEFNDAVHSGSQSARSVLLDGLASKAGAEITTFARAGSPRNEWMWIDAVVRTELQAFQDSNARLAPAPSQPHNTTAPEPIKRFANVQERVKRSGATLGQTLHQEMANSPEIFRQFQALHYTSYTSNALSANQKLDDSKISELVELYELLGSGLSQQELDSILGKDEISTRVLATLQRMARSAQAANPALSPTETFALLANMGVHELRVDAEGQWESTGRQITLTQMLLRHSVHAERQRLSAVLDSSPELQARFARLEEMTLPNDPHASKSKKAEGSRAERAFVEIIGSQQLYSLLGAEAEAFGAHLTVEQWIRMYSSRDRHERKNLEITVNQQAAYLGREKSSNFPYDLRELTQADSGLSSYRAIADAMFAAGRYRLTMDNDGTLHGEIAERSARTSTQFREALLDIQAMLRDFEVLNPRAKGETAAEHIQRMMRTHPDLDRRVMALIPNAAVFGVFSPTDDRTIRQANWVYEMFTFSDPKQAEMHYWRNLLLAEWRALGGTSMADEEAATESEEARRYSALPRRMHRLLYRMAKIQDMGATYRDFISRMENATDPEQFLKWVNQNDALRGNEAPFTLWVDDTAEFDADKARGGWTTMLQGAELREAVSMLRDTTASTREDIGTERGMVEADQLTLDAIERVVKYDAGDTSVTLDSNDRILYDALYDLIEDAASRRTGVGPQAQVMSSLGAVWGFYVAAHAKGTNPPHVTVPGRSEALRDEFGHVTAYERMIGMLTSLDVDEVGKSLGLTVRGDGRAMDEHGQKVAWTKPTVAEVVGWFRDPELRPFARDVLFPQVYEHTFEGRGASQFLYGKSLSDLLEKNVYSSLFAKNGQLSNDAAFKYLAEIEAEAQREGGSFSVQRAVNALAIARTSSATQELTFNEVQDLVIQAYRDVAKVLQEAAAFSIHHGGPGLDPVAEVNRAVKDAMKQARAGKLFGVSSKEVTDKALDGLIEDKRQEVTAEIERRRAELSTPPTMEEVEAFDRLVDALKEDLDRWIRRINSVRDEDVVATTVNMFTIDGTPHDRARKQEALVSYISSHLDMLERVPETALVLPELTKQILDPNYGGTVVLDDADWDILSRAAISMYLEDTASRSASFMRLGLFPESDRDELWRFYDQTFGYLVDPILDESSPLLRAAKTLMRKAGRDDGSSYVTQADIVQTVADTVLDTSKLGEWTTDISDWSISADERLDSSAAPAAVAMSGESPKQQAVFSAATRRTYEIPGEELLSKATLTAREWDAPSLNAEFAVLLPGSTEEQTRPLYQLNNRFARSVSVTLTNGTEVNLLDMPNMRKVWQGAPEVIDAGYVEIHLDRIRDAVGYAASQNGLSPDTEQASATVTVEFFHPDSQPADPKWANNVFFEGTSFRLDGDKANSLNETLWFSPNGMNQQGQRGALDAVKLGSLALPVVSTPDLEFVENLEAAWRQDLGQVLRNKTRLLMETDLGVGRLEAEFYNAVYKNLKMRHFVRGQDANGAPVLWTAEQVIAFQMANPGAELPLQNAELFLPSDKVLRTMYGEMGTKGVARFDPAQLEIDLSRVEIFRGSRTQMERVLQAFDHMDGEPLSLAQTSVIHRSRQRQLQVRPYATSADTTAFEQRMKYRARLASEIWTARSQTMQMTDTDFNAGRNLKAALDQAGALLEASNIEMDWSVVLPVIAPKDVHSTALSQAMLSSMRKAVSTSNKARAGWIFEEAGTSNPPMGVITESDLNESGPTSLRIAPGDLVVVRLETFQKNSERARQRLNYLQGRGAVIVLTDATADTSMIAEMQEYLSETQYEAVPGSGRRVFEPLDVTTRYQNQRARSSSLMEVEGVSPRSHALVFLTRGLPIEENAAIVMDPKDERLASVSAVANLVPVDAFGGYNVPATPQQIEFLRAQIEGWTDENGRPLEAIREMALSPDPDVKARLVDAKEQLADVKARQLKAPRSKQLAEALIEAQDRVTVLERQLGEFPARAKAFDEAWARMLTWMETPGTALPPAGSEFGVGDIIPLIDPTGTRVLLYRHGMKAPRRDQVEEMQARVATGEIEALGVATYTSIPEPSATIQQGQVIRFRPRAGYALSVEMYVPLQVFGDKKFVEWSGMKYLLTPNDAERGIKMPGQGVFDNFPVSLVSDLDSAISKGTRGVVNNHRDAFAYFGVDFLTDVTNFFFDGKGSDQASRAVVRDWLESLTRSTARRPMEATDELLHEHALNTALTPVLMDLGRPEFNSDWVAQLDSGTPEAQITRAAILYLTTYGARTQDILISGGFNDTSSHIDHQSIKMPSMFTRVFDRAPLGSALRTHVNEKLNDQVSLPGQDGSGYVLNQDFSVVITVPGEPPREGFLQFAELYSSGDNPVRDGMAFDMTDRQTVSSHTAKIAYQAIGAQTSVLYDWSRARLLGRGVQEISKDSSDASLWRELTSVPRRDQSFRRWQQQTPGEAARRRLAREARVQYFHEIEKTSDLNWSQTQIDEYEQAAVSLVEQLGLKAAQAELVDYWVRQYRGQPRGLDHDNVMQGNISGAEALSTLEDIAWNVRNRYFPTTGGEVSLMDLSHVQLLFRANRDNVRGWAPRESMTSNSAVLGHQDWDGWTQVALGSALASDAMFDPMYLLATDGFMHTYQQASDLLQDLAVSIDTQLSGRILDPQTNKQLVSLSPDINQVTADPLVGDAVNLSLSKMLTGDPLARGRALTALPVSIPPGSELAKRRAARKKWRLENGVPLPADISITNFRKNGIEFVESSTTTNSLARMLINLRVGTALINPALWISFGPEAMVRAMIDKAASLATGSATSGLAARGTALASQWMQGTALGDVFEQAGLVAQYTPEQLQSLKGLYRSMGQSTDFKGMLYRSLMFQRPHQKGMSRPEKWLEKYAQIGSRMQDPTYGIPGSVLARRYMESVLDYISAVPDRIPISVESLIARLNTDPMYVANNLPEVHAAALAAVAQFRSLKPTPISIALKSIYEPLSAHPSTGVNLAGNLLLKIPLLFSTYAANVGVTMTGMQGFSDFYAAWLDGAQKNGVVRRFQAMISGKELDAISERYDMSEVLESIDLSRSFIRGGITHTGLFTLGMLMGNLGLSGEDEEDRRRRRAAKLQNAAYVYDPRKIYNDARNADALYFKGMPVQMPWIAKQFISPIIGMERFFDSGDFRDVTDGFKDAFGSFPIVNTMMWNEAVETAQMFIDSAGEVPDDGTAGSMMTKTGFLISAVAAYEKMLFENSFVNQLYQSYDRYDRDPYKQPLLDSDGVIQRDAMGEPRNATALEDYVDPETGEVRQRYVSRSDFGGNVRRYTENRATAAAVLSLFTGFTGSDYLRYNMPIKTRKVEAPVSTKEEARQIFQATAQNTLGGAQSLNMEEALNAMRNSGSVGTYTRNAELEPIAKQIAEETGVTPLSILDEAGREQLTQAGGRAVFQGLAKGTVRLGDASLRGIHIPMNIRREIAEEWMSELIQEGVDMGLDETKAARRMNRIWNGWDHADGIGLADVVFSTDISYSDTLEYNQLNTTYVIGPDGLPMATGFERSGVFGALGLKIRVDEQGFSWGDRLITPEHGMMGWDSRANSTDLAAGQNLGMRALEPISPEIPTDQEIGAALTDALQKAGAKSYTPTDFKSGGGGGGGGGRGGGGGGGYSGYANFIRMNPFPDQRVQYGNNIPMINTSNPIIRRASIRRERVWSERGRLKQWQ